MTRKKLFLGALILALAIAAASLSTMRPIKGTLTSVDIDTALKTRADADANGELSVREIRLTLVDVIRGVLAFRQGYDVNADGTVDRLDISASVASFRRLLSAHCGNGTLEAGEQCDDGNTADGDGCSSRCMTEISDPSHTADLSVKFGVARNGRQPVFGITVTNRGPADAYYAVHLKVPSSWTLNAAESTPGSRLENGIFTYDGLERRSPGDEITESAAFNVNQDDVCGLSYEASVTPLSGTQDPDPRNNVVTTPIYCPAIPACGNGRLEAFEQCDDGNTASGDGCSTACAEELENPKTWSGSLGFIGGLAIPPTFNQGVHALSPAVAALGDAADRAVAAWTEGKLNSGAWNSPVTTSVAYAVFDQGTWTRRVLSPEVQFSKGRCMQCDILSLAADHRGGAHLFWLAPIHDVAGVIQDYALYTSAFSGDAFAEPRYVSGRGSLRLTIPSVAFNDAGEGVAAWEEFTTQTTGVLKAMRYSPAGGWSMVEDIVPMTAGADSIILNGGTNQLAPPAVGIDASGTITVAYRSNSVFADSSSSGLSQASRDDLYGVRWTHASGWGPQTVIAKDENNWVGPSHSYSGITYGHSIVDYALVINPDGTGMVAFTRADEGMGVGHVGFPIRRAYASRYDGQSWSVPVSVQGDVEGAQGLRLASDGDRYLVVSSSACDQAPCVMSRYFDSGAWTSIPVPGLPATSSSLFLGYFPSRGTFVLADAVGYASGADPEVYLQEFSPTSREWTAPAPSGTLSSAMRDAYMGSASAGLHRFFMLWSQERRTTYQNEPEPYYMYQLNMRTKTLAE